MVIMLRYQSFDGMSGSDTGSSKLDSILAAQPDEVKARFEARNPAKTLEFFGITPAMSIGEALPGGGWYTKILAPYLGEDGKLVGIDYTIDMWSEFGFANEAFIRAAHNLSRFEAEGGYLTQAMKTTYDVLKPGGVVGVVQHRAPAEWDDAAANGSAGYLKQANVIAAFEAAGFEFVKSSEVNANPKDQPEAGDAVWRLPPSLSGVGDDAALKSKRIAIGETDRMTLLFKKP